MYQLPVHLRKNAGAALLLALLATLAACDQGDKKAAPLPPPTPEVTAYTAVGQKVPLVAPFSGTLKAVQTVDIVPRVSGYVTKVYFKEGSDVKQGDQLYLIDPRPYQETLANYQAERDTQEASFKFWKGEVARFSKLIKQGAVSQQQLDNAVANRDKFAAQIQEQDANIKNAQLDLSFTTVRAPFDGRMQQTKVHEGANVTEQKDSMTSIVQLDPIYTIFNVSRNEAFAYKQIKQKGEGFTVDDMVVQVRLPDGSLFPNSGKIDFIGAEIDPTTDTAVVRGVLPNPVDADGAHALLPGQYVPVELTIGAIPDAVVVPTKAVVETQEGDFLYVIGQDNKVEYRKVKLGYSHNNLRVVEEGLKKGEKIVLDGLQKVKGGMTVKVTEAAAPTATATATKPAETSSETPAKKDDKKAADEQ